MLENIYRIWVQYDCICNWHVANKIFNVVFRAFAWTDFQKLAFFIHRFGLWFLSFICSCLLVWQIPLKEHHTDLVITSTCTDTYPLYIYISNNIPLKLLRFTKALRPPAKNGPSRQMELPNNLTRLQIYVFSCSRWGLVYTSLF